MDRLRSIKPIETRLMLRLANCLHSTHDPIVRKQHLLRGLCELVHGAAGACMVTQLDEVSRRPSVISEAKYPASAECPPRPLNSLDAPAQASQPAARNGNDIQILQSIVQLSDLPVSATIQLYRIGPSARRFTDRAHGLTNLFHKEMSWIYQADVVLISPNAMSLSPRARQTLELLLSGLGEKQIASQLRLSPNTVHHYVKSIHRHFGVSSRSELLARWVER
jgi:DNA-binding CsgD family transcriptional regulator